MKATDIRLHWIRDRETQKQFRFYCRPGTTKRGYYWNKRHCVMHHQTMRLDIMTPRYQLDTLRTYFRKRTPVLGLSRGCDRYGHMGCGDTKTLAAR